MEDKKTKAKEILRVLKKLFPWSKTILNYTTPWELLVAVILSARNTDKKCKKKNIEFSFFKRRFIDYFSQKEIIKYDAQKWNGNHRTKIKPAQEIKWLKIRKSKRR